MAIGVKAPVEVKAHLDNLYYNYWGINVNTVRTQIMVFWQTDGLKENEKWAYHGNDIEVVG